jgi:hypothetical protein
MKTNEKLGCEFYRIEFVSIGAIRVKPPLYPCSVEWIQSFEMNNEP